MPKIPDWRELGHEEQLDYRSWVSKEICNRLNKGETEYKSSVHGFQGDPLQHASEELLDGLFYVYYAMRERDALRDRIKELISIEINLLVEKEELRNKLEELAARVHEYEA